MRSSTSNRSEKEENVQRGVSRYRRIAASIIATVAPASVVHPAHGALLPGDILYAEIGFDSRLIGIHPDGTPSGFEVTTPFINDLVTGPDGTIYISTRGWTNLRDRVMRVDPVSGALSTVFTSPETNVVGGLRGLAVEPGGTLVLSTWNLGTLRIDPATGAHTVIRPTDTAEPRSREDVEIGLDGGIYVGTESGLPPIFRIDPVSGVRTPVSTGQRLGFGGHFTVAPNGMIYASNYPPGQGAPFTDQWQLVRVNPVTLEERVMWGTTNPNAWLVEVASDAGGFIYGAEMGFPNDERPDGAIVRFTPAGTRNVVLSGPNVINPYRIAVFVPQPAGSSFGLLLMGMASLRRRRRA